MFGSEQRDAAAQQLNLQPASDKFQTSFGELDQGRPDSTDKGKKSSAAVAAKAERDHHEHEAAGSANQKAAQKQSVPGNASLKQPADQQRAQTHSSTAAQQQGSGRPEVGVAGALGVDRPGAPKASSYGAQQKEQSSTKPATAAGNTYNLLYWAAQYFTWLLIKSPPKGTAFSFLFFCRLAILVSCCTVFSS